MKREENNWRFSSEQIFKSEWRLFIKEYQSSPTELVVSAINTRLSKTAGSTRSETMNTTQQAIHEQE